MLTYVPIVMYGLRLFIVVFYKNYDVYQIVYMFLSSESVVFITSPNFVCLHLLGF